METKKTEPEEKQPYVAPKVIATYTKEELEETIKPLGQAVNYGGCGCGCS